MDDWRLYVSTTRASDIGHILYKDIGRDKKSEERLVQLSEHSLAPRNVCLR